MSDKRTAVITGASSGFGRLTAEAFAADGWRVYGTVRNVQTKNAAAVATLRAKGIQVVELDVTDDASVEEAAATILAEAGAVDVLVNNAGQAFFGLQEGFTPSTVERQFATNVVGPVRVNRAFLPAMRARGSGLIVYVSSVVGRIVLPFAGVYSASKWALEALAESASYELAPFGIDVAIVEPGAYPTEIFEKITMADDASRVASYGDAIMAHMERMSAAMGAAAQERDPREVAEAILRLANQPAGTRPLRTPVPENPAVGAINDAIAPIQRGVLENYGLGELLAAAAVAR